MRTLGILASLLAAFGLVLAYAYQWGYRRGIKKGRVLGGLEANRWWMENGFEFDVERLATSKQIEGRDPSHRDSPTERNDS